MKVAVQDFTGTEMPVEEMIAFYKDYARVLSMHDLCHIPNYDYADVILDNAVSLLGGVDYEILEIRKQILRGNVSLHLSAAQVGGAKDAPKTKVILAKGQANEAILDGDLIGGFRIIWKLVCDYGAQVPELVAPQLDWLATTMEKFFEALDEPYRSGLDDLLSEMASHAEVLANVPIRYTPKFIAALAGHGLKVTIDGVERDSDNIAMAVPEEVPVE